LNNQLDKFTFAFDWGRPTEVPDPSDADSLEAGLAAGQTQLVRILALALALQREPELRAAVAGTRTPHAYAICFGNGGPYLKVHDGKITGSALVSSEAPLGETLDIYESLKTNAEVTMTLHSRMRAAHDDAERLIVAMTEDADRFAAADFEKLEPWSAVLASDAYRQGVLIQLIIDHWRPHLVEGLNDETLRSYWKRIHSLSHLTLLAASAEPTSWLAGMARSFTWQTWTPSFPLVRERVLRLAVRGGWTSARFGPEMIEPYVKNVISGQLLRAFDAVLAIVSIAVAHDGERKAISAELFARLEERDRVASEPNERLVLGSLTRSARLALDHPAEAIARTLRRSRRPRKPGGATERRIMEAMDTDEDPAYTDDAGFYPCIVAMAGLARLPPGELFTRSPRTSDRSQRARAAETLRRTRNASAN
jgi:hypothetical protein